MILNNTDRTMVFLPLLKNFFLTMVKSVQGIYIVAYPHYHLIKRIGIASYSTMSLSRFHFLFPEDLQSLTCA